MYYKLMAHFIATIHLILITLNTISIPLLIMYQPFYIYIPLISVLASPIIGGTYCLFNRAENKYRLLAGMPLIQDRVAELFRKGD